METMGGSHGGHANHHPSDSPQSPQSQSPYAKDVKPEKSYSTEKLALCSAELGFWHCLTVALQSWGVSFTSATRAGFIATTTTMMVPFISVALGISISGRVWASSAVVMLGTALIVYAKGAGQEDADGNLDHIMYGDMLTLLGSFFWAICLLRLSRHAAALPYGPLVITRSVFIAFFMGIWWAYDEASAAGEAHRNGGDHKAWPWAQSARMWSLILFMGIGPGYACAWLQTMAQASVPAAKAQILMSSTPLWGAAWAAILLGEAMDLLGWVGGITIVTGTVLVALDKQE
jgi:drug/metabolite transporter (DMT)-like permease